MSEDQQVGIPVELSYTPTVEDFREALTARSKAATSARRARVLLTVAFGCALVGTALSLLSGGTVDPPVVVMLVSLAVVLLGLPWLQARQFHKLAAGKGEYRVVVDLSGVTVVTAEASSTLTWKAAPRYAETAGLFVLLSGDRNASCITLLPKRGLADRADADRLRNILDEHLTRVGPAPRPAAR